MTLDPDRTLILRLRPYQQRVVELFHERRRQGDRRLHVVAPPGSGKTIIGVALILEARRKAVVFSPNAAIQAQWVDRFKAETGWLEDKSIKNALQSGDHHTAFIQRAMMITRAKERARWANMPINRYKGIRKTYFRIKRKLLSIVKRDSQP